MFLIGCFARNDLLWGARGYRRTLLSGGRIAERIAAIAFQVGLQTRIIYEFDDHRVDAAIDVDGVEEGTLAVIELRSENG